MYKKITTVYNRGGAREILRRIIPYIRLTFKNIGIRIKIFFTRSKYFIFNDRKLKYFNHIYNYTHTNERTVEVPIVMSYLDDINPTLRVLEVGNVLQNYAVKTKRDILDKYDHAIGLINSDVVDFQPHEKYDLIVSISTLEHVGWDESIKVEDKIPDALRNLKKNCLNKGGRLIATLPMGYNSFFDKWIRSDQEIFSNKFYLKRITLENDWVQVAYSQIEGVKFNEPYNNANALFVGEILND